jgi:prepilin-type N-terminal cleavage/methylation domain-containing protein
MISLRIITDGYTLVELTIVILLLCIIALACADGFHFGTQVWAHVERSVQTETQTVSAQTFLRTLLSSIIPRQKGNDVSFEGQPSAMDFDVFPPRAFQGGTAHAGLRIVQMRDRSLLELKLQSLASPNIEKRTILLDDVKLMSFSYLDTTGKSGTWLAYWRDRNRLPAAIRISGGDATRWQTIIIRPIIVQSANCIFDSEEMTCRKI